MHAKTVSHGHTGQPQEGSTVGAGQGQVLQPHEGATAIGAAATGTATVAARAAWMFSLVALTPPAEKGLGAAVIGVGAGQGQVLQPHEGAAGGGGGGQGQLEQPHLGLERVW